MPTIVTVRHDDVLCPRSRSQNQRVEGGQLLPRHYIFLKGHVLLVLALHRVILAIVFGNNVDAHIRALQRQLGQQLLGNILEQPDVRQLADMLQVLDAELLEDIATDLLVVTGPHLGEGVCRFIVPLLALG